MTFPCTSHTFMTTQNFIGLQEFHRNAAAVMTEMKDAKNALLNARAALDVFVEVSTHGAVRACPLVVSHSSIAATSVACPASISMQRPSRKASSPPPMFIG